jgi:hypothetical protein
MNKCTFWGDLDLDVLDGASRPDERLNGGPRITQFCALAGATKFRCYASHYAYPFRSLLMRQMWSDQRKFPELRQYGGLVDSSVENRKSADNSKGEMLKVIHSYFLHAYF